MISNRLDNADFGMKQCLFVLAVSTLLLIVCPVNSSAVQNTAADFPPLDFLSTIWIWKLQRAVE